MTDDSVCPMYPRLDARELEPQFSSHMSAMTAEALHDKSDIAEQLAWRDRTIARLRAELACARVPRVPRTPVGPFTNDQLKSRPILLETDDAALGQLRDLVNALGNWHDFAAFNEVLLASARELNEEERAVVEAAIVFAQRDACESSLSGWPTIPPVRDAVDALLALRAKKAGE